MVENGEEDGEINGGRKKNSENIRIQILKMAEKRAENKKKKMGQKKIKSAKIVGKKWSKIFFMMGPPLDPPMWELSIDYRLYVVNRAN